MDWFNVKFSNVVNSNINFWIGWMLFTSYSFLEKIRLKILECFITMYHSIDKNPYKKSSIGNEICVKVIKLHRWERIIISTGRKMDI